MCAIKQIKGNAAAFGYPHGKQCINNINGMYIHISHATMVEIGIAFSCAPHIGSYFGLVALLGGCEPEYLAGVGRQCIRKSTCSAIQIGMCPKVADAGHLTSGYA